MPDDRFPRNQYHDVPLGRNIIPISECKVREHVGPDAKLRKAVEVRVLTCGCLWETFHDEAMAVVSESGKLIDCHIERHRRINAAYANLWLADHRFQWAALTAFTSQQVGCGMLHARSVMMENEQLNDRFGRASLALFLDVYPLHRFFMERGLKDFLNCLNKRQELRAHVYWPLDGNALAFGMPDPAIREAFEAIEAGNIEASVQALLRHEHENILQKAMYNDRKMQRALDADQFAWVSGLLAGDYTQIQVSLSGQCKTRTRLAGLFPRERTVKLYDKAQRLTLAQRAAHQFDKLVRGPERTRLEQSLREISAGGGVR